METATLPPPETTAEVPARQAEFILDALKAALAGGAEHRLFRAGKFPGLFPSRSGPAGEAATAAVRTGLVGIVRTESRGKGIVEFVRATPAGVAYVNEHDSPKAVLRELRELLDAARGGVPGWMADARDEVSRLADRFETRAAAVLTRLDALATRVDDALRRAELSPPGLTDPMARLVPWGVAALEYLDCRRHAGAAAVCPLGELFHAAASNLTLADFHAGLRRLHDSRAVRLVPGDAAEPEYAMVVDGVLAAGVTR